MRDLGQVKFDSNQYSDKSMLLNFEYIKSAELNKNLTALWGKESDRFPLLSLTEGNGAILTKKAINSGDTQYKWNVASRQRVTFVVKRLIEGGTKPGANFGTIKIETTDRWAIYQHTAIAPSGVQYRIQNDGEPLSTGGYMYVLQNMSGDKNSYSPLTDFINGSVWALGSSSIPTSKSDGNRSNNQSTAKATNQYGLYRFSKQIAGNIGNTVVDIEFDLEGGGKTNLWMPYEMKQWELLRRDMLEEDLWFSEYNRDINGIIHLTDPKTGEVVPRGAGVKDILKAAGNYETYSKMSLQRFDRIISRLFDNRVDSTMDDICLYIGKGFAREFNDAIYADARMKNYFMTLGEKEIMDSDNGMLSYGRYFNKYKMINGKTLTLKLVDIFDNGIRARQDRELGRIYKGLPLSSYTGVFLNHSLGNNGERNIKFVCEEGREFKVGVYKGMATLPNSWGLAEDNRVSDTQDIASYEVLGSQGINFDDMGVTSFWMDMATD